MIEAVVYLTEISLLAWILWICISDAVTVWRPKSNAVTMRFRGESYTISYKWKDQDHGEEN